MSKLFRVLLVAIIAVMAISLVDNNVVYADKPDTEKTAKGKPVAKGTCPECGTKVNRFLSAKDAG